MYRFRPTVLQEYLRSIQAHPKKGLSQNFLIDGNILNKIVCLAECQKGDLVVEIGPGPGALTEKLLEKGCKVVAIEKDALFADALIAENHPGLTVFQADALDFPFKEALIPHEGKAKVVANLPYSLTTPILQRILLLENVISSATVMVQEEVARRLCFPCDKKDYVAFTLFLHYYSKPHFGFTVSPKCFYPVPRVHSAVMRLDLEKRFTVQNEELFFAEVNAAFSHRRKMLKASLKAWYDPTKVENALKKIGKAKMSRPEDLSLEEWITLSSLLYTHSH